MPNLLHGDSMPTPELINSIHSFNIFGKPRQEE